MMIEDEKSQDLKSELGGDPGKPMCSSSPKAGRLKSQEELTFKSKNQKRPMSQIKVVKRETSAFLFYSKLQLIG